MSELEDGRNLQIDGKMCQNCFRLFEKASKMILNAHSSEMSRLSAIIGNIQDELTVLRSFVLASKSLPTEVVSFINRCSKIEGFGEYFIESSSFASKQSEPSLPETKELKFKPIPSNQKLLLTTIPEASASNQEKENVYKSQNPIVGSSHNPKQTKTLSILSRESSLEGSASRQKQNRSNSRNSKRKSHLHSANSDKKSTPKRIESELDRKIRELEQEKLAVERHRDTPGDVHESPLVSNLPRHKHFIGNEGGKSLETELTTISNNDDRGVPSRHMEGHNHNSDQNENTNSKGQKSKTVSGTGSGGNSKITSKNIMSLVYKVNTKQKDFEKVQYNMQKPKNGEGKKTSQHQKTSSSISGSFIEESSEYAAGKCAKMKPLALDQLKKSMDNSNLPLGTPHF